MRTSTTVGIAIASAVASAGLTWIVVRGEAARDSSAVTPTSHSMALPSTEPSASVQCIEQIKTLAVAKTLAETFGATHMPLYVEKGEWITKALSMTRRDDIRLTTRAEYDAKYGKMVHQRPVFVTVEVRSEADEPGACFHVIIEYFGAIGVGGYRDCAYSIADGKVTLVEDSHVVQ